MCAADARPAPKHLSVEARAQWARFVAGWSIDDALMVGKDVKRSSWAFVSLQPR